MVVLSKKDKNIEVSVALPASKSISNRVLVIQFLMNNQFNISNLSNCNDSTQLKAALQQIHESEQSIDINIGEAGTSYRFLTALLAVTPGNFTLSGASRLMQRPITPLVDALRQLGADIQYKNTNQQGPLLINGKQLEGGTITLNAQVSSQFITALLLVAPYFRNGLKIFMSEKVVSFSYILMTIQLMKHFGASVHFEKNMIQVIHQPYQVNFENYIVESDWTAASYWYALAALSNQCTISLQGLRKDSLQGDSLLAPLFNIYGVHSSFENNSVKLTKAKNTGVLTGFDFIDNPDLVQTFAFLNAALKAKLQVNEAGNLRLKETDRIAALKNELSKIGVTLHINSDNDFFIDGSNFSPKPNLIFETYQDHRMAMIAPIIAMQTNEIRIANEQVVSKSYPDYWNHLQQAGFTINFE